MEVSFDASLAQLIALEARYSAYLTLWVAVSLSIAVFSSVVVEISLLHQIVIA